MRKIFPFLPASSSPGRSLLSGLMLSLSLLLTLPPAGLARAELDLLEGEKIKPQPGADTLLDSKLLELDLDLPDFPAAREAMEKERTAQKDPKPGWALLSESVRVDFAAFTRKVAELRRGEMRPELDKTVLEVRDKAKLDEDGLTRLKALADAALDESLRNWETDFTEKYAPDLVKGDAEALLKSWKPEQFTVGTAPSPLSPVRTGVWKEGLKKIVTPEYYAAAEAEAKAAREEARQIAGRVLLDAENNARQVLSNLMDAELERVLVAVELDESREKAIRKAAEDTVTDILKRWRDRAEKRMEEMDEPILRQVQQLSDLGVGDPLVGNPWVGNQPQDSEIWRTARNAVLTGDEWKAVVEGQEQLKKRRADALARIILAEMDQQVGFSEAQREKLLELCDGRFQSPGERGTERRINDDSIPDPGSLLPELQEIPEARLAAVLDPGQTARWKAVSQESLPQARFFFDLPRTEAESGKESVDELEASRLITLKLADEAAKIKERYFSRMEGRVENLARVTALPPEATARLRTAGKGAAEQLALNAVANLEQSLMSQVSGAKPAEVPGRLAKFSLFGGYQERGPQTDPPVWETAMKRVLTKAQRESWQRESQAGQAWRRRALCALVASEVERHAPLSPAKNALLRERLDGVLKKYESDIANMMSPGWQYQSYYCAIPVALLTEKEMAEVFTPKQLEAVRSECLAQAEQFAAMIRRRRG